MFGEGAAPVGGDTHISSVRSINKSSVLPRPVAPHPPALHSRRIAGLRPGWLLAKQNADATSLLACPIRAKSIEAPMVTDAAKSSTPLPDAPLFATTLHVLQ